MTHFQKKILFDNKTDLLLSRSQIEGYTRLLFSGNFLSYPLLFEPTRLLIFKKISSLPAFSPTQKKNFPPYPLLLEPTGLLNLKKNSSLPFY